MSDCLFCKIAMHEIPSNIVFENEVLIGFRDINPAAPTHILFVPKRHSKNLNDIHDVNIITDIIEAVREVAKREGVDKSGYRIVINNNKDAGQEVFHTHVHLIGGRRLGKMA